MEPLSAFSLACNILQIVEYGANVLSRAAEYRTAPNGTLNQHNTLYDVLQSLKGLNAELGASLPAYSSSHRATVPGTRLAAANQECMRIAGELITLLGRLKVKKSSTIEGIRMSIKSIWHESTVKALKHDLAEAKEDLSFALMLFMQQSNTTKHTDLLRSNHESETRIVDALKSTSGSLSSEIQALTAQLDNTSLLSVDDALRDFQVSHKDTLAGLSRKLDAILSHQEASHLVEHFSSRSNQDEVAQQRIIDNLTFPQVDERRNKIHRAHRNTFEWVLDPGQSQRQFDDLLSWAKLQDVNRQIYWVYGKPGSGKSTLMRYLFDELDKDLHFHPWSEDGPLLKMHYFFWAPGTPLQKSFHGLLRSLLAQIFSYSPQIIEQFVTPAVWNKARLTSIMGVHWTPSDLIQILMAIVNAEMWYMFFLIDGLDEFEGTDQERDDFLDLIHNISSLSHVKLCVSSRPWNIFQDAFDEFPKLRLEDHTQEDIRYYVDQKLDAQRRFRQLRLYDPSSAEFLISTIFHNASGVFLWVRLVVYELGKALRDGDNIHQLLRRVEVIPKDLDSYFTHLMNSIEPQYHKEASVFIQLALYEEHEFITLHSLSLLDVVCVKDIGDNSIFEKQIAIEFLDFSNLEKMRFNFCSALRQINSRCLGLLECHNRGLGPLECHYVGRSTIVNDESELEEDITPASLIFDWEVGFLHRSLRDFLSLPSSQHWLHEYSGDLLDVRVLLCNARLLQIEALNRSAVNDDIIVGVASHVLSAIAVPELRNTEYSKTIASRLKPVLDRVVEDNDDEVLDKGAWYIRRSLSHYHYHCSSFLTIAIDFNLSAYVDANLTRETICEKIGRPILDYILIGTFFEHSSISIGNRFPDLGLLQRALDLGADPNEVTAHGSAWASYLSFLRYVSTFPYDYNDTMRRGIQETFLRAVIVLLHSGADPIVSWPSGDRWIWRPEARMKHITSVADYFVSLHPHFLLVAKSLEDCIALASLKLAEKMAANNERLLSSAPVS